MVEFPLVSVLGDGVIENVRMSIEHPDSEPEIELKGMSDIGGVVEQLQKARQVAQVFLTRPYVKPVAAHTLERGKLVVEFDSAEAYKGESFGLSFLVGCLSLGLQAPIRREQLFSAAIAKHINQPNMPGGGVLLGPVVGIGEKLAAACIHRQSKLYFYSDNENSALNFEKAFWRGEIERNCQPCILPERISASAVLAIALDTEQLLQKAILKQNGEAFLMLMFHTCSLLSNGMSFVKSIGKSVAFLRQKGRLEKIMMLKELMNDLNAPPIQNGELFISFFLERCFEASPSDRMWAELIKAAISNNPELPLFISPEDSFAEETQINACDFGLWIKRETAAHPLRLRLLLAILRICNRLAVDMSAYWAQTKKLILKGIEIQLEQILQGVQQKNINQTENHLRMLLNTGLGGYLSRIQPDWIPEIRYLFTRYLSAFKMENLPEFSKMFEAICYELTLHYLPDVLKPLQVEQSDNLVLSFRLRDSLECVKENYDSYPRPPLSQTNDLVLSITGPNNLSLHIPSPVLLMEHCYEQHENFCRRQGMTLSDDTLCRYPINDAITAWELFTQPYLPVVIGFQVPAQHQETNFVSIKWISTVNPWPPAIDSQLLVASILRYGQDENFQELLDVGCGTGYLGIVAAHRWPTIQQLHLLDIDPPAVAAAKMNFDENLIGRQIDCITHIVDFRDLPEQKFDVIICSPPYLPERPLRVTGIEMATNGTALLEEVVIRSARMARELWMVFSGIAWPEFRRALAKIPDAYETIEILRRDVVPFRIPWLEPVAEEEKRDPWLFADKYRYYHKTLIPRGLIDMDSHLPWTEYLSQYTPDFSEDCSAQLICHQNSERIERTLDEIEHDSRGYRFWHEVRVVRLTPTQ